MFAGEQVLETGSMPEITDDAPVVFDDDNQIDDGIVDESKTDEASEEAKAEDEKEVYSRNVQKRIDKLTYQKNIALERTAKLEHENKEIRQRLDEIAKAQQEDFASRNKYTQDQQRQDLLARKKEALEMADFDLVTQIDDELFDLKLKQQTIQQPRQEQAPREAEPSSQQAYVPEAMKAWEANNSWIYDQANPKAQVARKLFADMVQKEGFDFEDQDTFNELDKRLRRQPPPSSGGPDRGQVVNANKGVNFTSEDRQKMRDWNLDPDNPAHRAEWLKNKSK